MFDLNEMAIFAQVVDAGSFTAAAERLGLPKSSISRKVSQLEERVGVRLLNRTTRQIKLTEMGRQYYQYCARISEQAEEADRLIHNLQAEPSGRLTISAPTGVGTPFVGELISDFLDRYPKVSIEIRLENHIVDLIDEEVDVAFRVGQLQDSSIIARPLGVGSMILCASPAYADRNGLPQSPMELADHSFIHYDSTPFILKGDGYDVNIPIRLINSDLRFNVDLVLNDFGIAPIPAMLCAEYLKNGAMLPVLPNYPLHNMALHLVYASRKQLATKITTFVEYVLERCTPTPPWEIIASEVSSMWKEKKIAQNY